MSFTTGNPERDSLIKRGIAECLACHEEATYGNVHEKLSHLPGFDLGEDELAGLIGAMTDAGGGALPEIESPPETLNNIEAPRAAEAGQPSLYTAEVTTGRKITRAEAQHRVEAAHVRLAEVRVNVRIAQEQKSRAKTKLADCIMAWQAAADPVSPELRREREARRMIETGNQLRAQKHNPTAITAKQFVQKRMTNGGNARGAFSREQAARLGYRMPGSKAQ